MKHLALSSLLVVCLFAAACSEAGDAPNVPEAPSSAAPQAGADWLLSSEPANAVSVREAKSSAAEGDEVVVRARIGGRLEPIAADSPVFTVVDMAVQHCDQLHAGACPTPWDYCCEPPDSLKANAATVQLVDGEGKALAASPTDQLAALDEIVVVGTVGPRPSEDVLTVKATAVYRAPRTTSAAEGS